MNPSIPNHAGRRNYYEGDVDFDTLAANDEDFAAIAKVAKETRRIDFQDPRVLQTLTKALLKQDFALTLSLPPDRLCPPIPVRWNYIRWIQQLLDTTRATSSGHHDETHPVAGLDIGVGASCIYPLLATSTRPDWHMLGSEIDARSLAYARRNVEANGLGERIELTQTTPDAPVIPLSPTSSARLDFTMTNPPFYCSRAEMASCYLGKSAAPSAICTGAPNEMICAGGEVGFVSRILDESLRLRGRVQWYTAMVGRLPSLQQIVSRLKAQGVTNFAVASLQAGYKTNRWAVAWSFGDWRPRNDVVRRGQLVGGVLPMATAQTVAATGLGKERVGERVDEAMKGLDVQWWWREGGLVGVVEARRNVWSRAARRKRKFGQAGVGGEGSVEREGGDEEEGKGGKVALAVEITCEEERVEVRWLRGMDYVLFTSFCGMLKTTLATAKQ